MRRTVMEFKLYPKQYMIKGAKKWTQAFTHRFRKDGYMVGVLLKESTVKLILREVFVF